MELRAGRRVGRDLRRPTDCHRVPCATEMGGEELHALIWGAAGPGPAGVILVVDLGCAEHVEAAQVVEGPDVHVNRGGDAVLGSSDSQDLQLARF